MRRKHQRMDEPPRRRVTLADLLLLIAAVGVASALDRAILVGQGLRGSPASMLSVTVTGACWVALALSIALIPIRLRRPRPEWALLRDRPGFVASIAALSGLVLETINDLPAMSRYPHGVESWLYSTPFPTNIAPLVAVSWLVLALGGRWSTGPGPDWVDRAGLALGVLWLVAFGAGTVAFFWAL